MQRNIGSELVVALLVLAALLLALAFAIVLSTATRSVGPATPTHVPTALSSPRAIAATSASLSPAATVAETAATITTTPSATELQPATAATFASPSATASASPEPLATEEARIETPADFPPPSTADERTALAKTAAQEEPIGLTKEFDRVTSSPTGTASAVRDIRDTPARTRPATSIGATEEGLDVGLAPRETPAVITGTATPIRRTPVVKPKATDVPSPTATDRIVETATSVQRDVRVSPTALVKRTATATAIMPTATTMDVPSPTATEKIAETATSVERDIRASRTALAKRTATATSTSTATDVASPTATARIAETATSTERDIRASLTALLKRTATATASATATTTDVPSPTATAKLAATATSVERDTRVRRTALLKRTATTTATSTATDVASPTATDRIAETATSVERDTLAGRTALVKPTATATSISTATDVASPTATDKIVESATSVKRDIRASRTALVKRTATATATATATTTDVPSPTATARIAETATSVERDTRVRPTALVKRTAIATVTASATSTTTDVLSPTATEKIAATATREERDTRASRTALVKQTATATLDMFVATGIFETVTGVPVIATKDIPASRALTPMATKTVSVEETERASQTGEAADLVYQPTVTPTVQASATASMLPLVYSRLVPTPTALGLVPVTQMESCDAAIGWAPYQVAEGDNLLAIAESIGTSIVEIQKGNCFEPIRGVLAGETLLLPAIPSLPPATTVPVFPDASDPPTVIGCESESSRIVSPVAMQEIRGIIQVIGSVNLPENSKFRLDVRPAWSDKYSQYIEGFASVTNDVIGLINSEVFGIGLHRLRLSIVDEYGAMSKGAICDVPIVFAMP